MVCAGQFGFEEYADELAQLIMDRKKTATCSAYVLYELGNEPLSTVGMYTIVLSSKMTPLPLSERARLKSQK